VNQLERRNKIEGILVNATSLDEAVFALLMEFREVERENNLAAIKQAQIEVQLMEQMRNEARRELLEVIRHLADALQSSREPWLVEAYQIARTTIKNAGK
jgi:hypothetical protein